VDNPLLFDSIRPVHFYCEAPSEVHRGESVGIRCMIMNRSPYDLETVIILQGSEEYKFIHVEEYGNVEAYNPRTSGGDHHHLVFVRGQDELEVHLPIKPTANKEQGVITAYVTLSTQIMSNTQAVTIKILPEGSIVHRHTSILLDLKSRAFEIEYMNIIVDESPVIPYEVYMRYIYGSPYGRVSVSGDVIGPTFMNNEPVHLESMFPDGNGRFGKGTEYHAFNLAANTWQLHYYRLTNQLQNNWELAKKVFERMNIEYTAVMRRFSSQGWVSIWDTAKPSVWLTSWCIRIFSHVSFQDWEDYIYIDPEVFGSSVMWLINYQSIDGEFFETEHYTSNPLHKPMGKSKDGSYISLTAHVLIALQETAPKLYGDMKKFSSSARQRARRFLERNLPKVTDSYDLAIVSYALVLSRSPEADAAYGRLLQMKREESGMVYWSPTKINTNRGRYEFNRPFLEAKDKQIKRL
jgi:CD109 antigen